MLGIMVIPGGGGVTEVASAIALRSSSGPLDDTDMEIGTIVNAGAGWNTFKFREQFDDIPVVAITAQEFSGWIEIKNIAVDGFLYCLRESTLTPGSTGMSGSYVSTVTFPTLTSTTTAKQVVINYIAIEYGGER